MNLFNWHTRDATYKLNIDVGVYLDEIKCCFEFFDAKFNVVVPLPFAKLNPFKVSRFLVYKTFIYGKEYAGVKRRTIEFQIDNVPWNFGFGFGFCKLHEITDHDPTEFYIKLGCFRLLITSSHPWHVFDTDIGLRYPTEEEACKIVEYADVLKRKMFGGTPLPCFTQNKAEREKLDNYYKQLQEFKANTLHIIGEGTWNEIADAGGDDANDEPTDGENIVSFGHIRNKRVVLDLNDIINPSFCLGKTRFKLTGNKPSTVTELKQLLITDGGDLTDEDYDTLNNAFTLDDDKYDGGSFYHICLQAPGNLDIYNKMVAAWFKRVGEITNS